MGIMRSVKSHVYAKSDRVMLYAFPADHLPALSFLKKGDWLGVLCQENGWLKVISHQFQGWVAIQDVEERTPFSLHALRQDQNTIRYVSGEHPE